jgi:hypothetical protein
MIGFRQSTFCLVPDTINTVTKIGKQICKPAYLIKALGEKSGLKSRTCHINLPAPDRLTLGLGRAAGAFPVLFRFFFHLVEAGVVVGELPQMGQSDFTGE